MNKINFAFICSLIFLSVFLSSQAEAKNFSDPRVNVQIITDEADAVLQILDKKETGQEITEADWQRVFKSEGYTPLKNANRR